MNTTARSTQGGSVDEWAFEHHPVQSLVVDRQAGIVSINRSARALFAQTDDAKISGHASLSEMTGIDSGELMQEIVMGASVGFVVLPIASSGGKIPAGHRFSVTALRTQNRRTDQFLLTFALDAKVSRKFIRLTNMIRNSNLASANELAAAQRLLHRQLQQSYKRVNDFSATAAHDLKGPLQNISSLLGILEEDNGHEISGDGIEVLRFARKSADKLVCVIAGLLEHAKAKSAGVHLEPVDLATAVNSVREDLRVTISQSKGCIKLVGRVESISADPLLFNQLLGNLIGNAFKYLSPERAPEILISCERISPTMVEIRFQDNGMGFDSKYSQIILEPFQRLDSTSEVEGSGLGLATCQTICKLHGWTIQCKGQADAGATFIIHVDSADNAALAGSSKTASA